MGALENLRRSRNDIGRSEVVAFVIEAVSASPAATVRVVRRFNVNR